MYKYKGEEINDRMLAMNPWLDYLYNTNNISVNMERVEVVERINGKEALEYTLKTLEILEKIASGKSYYGVLERALQWCEVAKGGTYIQREKWRSMGYPVDIHNLASAEIYKMQSCDSINMTYIVYTLIKSHGLIGQAIRGEVNVSKNSPVIELLNFYSNKELYDLLYDFNRCIIEAVSCDIWNSVSEDVEKLIKDIIVGDFSEYTADERIGKLCPNVSDITDEGIEFFKNNIFPYYELWYFTAAVDSFTFEEVLKILQKVVKNKAANKVQHLNFKPLSDSLHYDYEGKKHVNVYKKRIIEKYLRDDSIENVYLDIHDENNTIYIDFKFSKACEKLIDFCVEAERSGIITYEKAITVLFDMFGFRRDEFDRLNNEDKYLRTMNESSSSTKNSIAYYVVGDSVVDVGSGGGVMLDLLEEIYPKMNIVGTDISKNVIATLKAKAVKENHKWGVKVHNFVDCPFDEKVDNIIFSSILHEIYSYTEKDGMKFNIESVVCALKNAYESLNKGGRIIIRDGVKTDSNALLKVRFKTAEGMAFFKNYCKDFKGLPELAPDERCGIVSESEMIVEGNINFMREFLYTYTWGNESYAHEVNEQFGYLTIPEYKQLFKELGMNLIECKSFLEAGYKTHLDPLVELFDEKGNPAEFPESNLIIVAEKILDN